MHRILAIWSKAMDEANIWEMQISFHFSCNGAVGSKVLHQSRLTRILNHKNSNLIHWIS